MSDGVFLWLPWETIAIRVIVASVIAVILARLLLRAGIRVPRLRAATVLVPSMAVVAVVAIFWSNPRLPTLLRPGADGGFTVPVDDTFLSYWPMAVPILVGAWAAVAGVRVLWRVRRLRCARRDVLSTFTLRTTAPGNIQRLAAGVAARMRIATPPVAVVEDCPGGATVVGVRRPVLILDAELVARLDDQELEGVLAHELAHIRRRDNLMTTGLGILRDLFFFVPGAGWAIRRLHGERELAADQLAVAVTSRPGALASGLLKVLDLRKEAAGCSALVPAMPENSLVGRIRQLVEPSPISRTRAAVEGTVLVTALSVAIASGVALPGMMTRVGIVSGNERFELDGLGLAWAPAETPAEPVVAGQARVFETYRSTPFGDEAPAAPRSRAPVIDDDPLEISRGMLRACSVADRTLCGERHALPLRGLPQLRIDDALLSQVRATHLASAGELRVYLIHRRDG